MAKARFIPSLWIAFAGAVALLNGSAYSDDLPVLTGELRCECFVDPIGIDVAKPVLSWVVSSSGLSKMLSGFHVLVASSNSKLESDVGDIWDSGEVAGDDPIQTAYSGVNLISEHRYFWKVRVHTNVAGSRWGPWSAPAQWTMGLLKPTDWSAQWISAPAQLASLPIFAKTFTLNKPVQRAVVYVCGLGQYELHINGAKVGDSVLEPGWTNYRKTCLYVGCDVTNRLRSGRNAIGVMLGNGMYDSVSGRYAKFVNSIGPLKVILHLQIEYADGTFQNVVSDESWKSAAGPITFSSIYGGEDYDSTLEKPDWDNENPEQKGWLPAIVTSGPGGKLKGISSSAPPVKVMRVITPLSKRVIGPASVVYDLGQNCADMPRVVVHGRRGAQIRLVPSEMLGTDGTATQKITGRGVWFSYKLSGKGDEVWSPRFSYYGCRYIQVEGAVPEGAENPDNLPVIESLVGQFITSDSTQVGNFSCSNALFTRTANLINWAMRSNMVSVLTDCPTREKLGWLEQDHLVGPSLMYDFDMQPLFRKVVNDMRDAQTTDGLVPDIAPEYTTFSGGFRDSPEWGSSAVLVPWETYQTYGDKQVLANNYPMMQKYIAYLGTNASENMLDFGLGDWYDIGPLHPGKAQLTPISLTATAFYFLDLITAGKAARILGHADDATKYDDMAARVRKAFIARFYNPGSQTYSTGSQTAMAIPLVMGMVDPANVKAVLDNLVASIKVNDNKLTSGDVGYRYLLRSLADGGRSDVIFDMNIRSDRPGYGMMLDKGQTALSEAWDASPDASEDHFMLGHINEWFYENIAGISQEKMSVAYARIRIKPAVVGDVTWVKANYKSVRGEIGSSWKVDGGKFTLDVRIPVGATASVWLPTGNAASVKIDAFSQTQVVGGKVTPGWTTFITGSGNHHFECELKK